MLLSRGLYSRSFRCIRWRLSSIHIQNFLVGRDDDSSDSSLLSSSASAPWPSLRTFPLSMHAFSISTAERSHSFISIASKLSTHPTQLTSSPLWSVYPRQQSFHPSIPPSIPSTLLSQIPSSSILLESPIHYIPSRRKSTLTTLTDLLHCPEYTPTLYGLSGLLLQSFHTHLYLPYWASISLLSVVVRTSLIPTVIQSARTSVRFSKVAPEVQYLISMFMNDFKKLKMQSSGNLGGWRDTTKEQMYLVKYTLITLRGVFKLHEVNLMDFFKVKTTSHDFVMVFLRFLLFVFSYLTFSPSGIIQTH